MTSAPAAGPARRAQGFTLLELMIAMSVISIALFGILSMITQVMAMREINLENEAAKEWVQQEIEKVKSYPFGSLNTISGSPPTPNYLANSGTAYLGTTAMPLHTPPALPSASGIVRVDYSNSSLYEIVVTLNWKSRKGTGAYVMRSLYCQPGT